MLILNTVYFGPRDNQADMELARKTTEFINKRLTLTSVSTDLQLFPVPGLYSFVKASDIYGGYTYRYVCVCVCVCVLLSLVL